MVPLFAASVNGTSRSHGVAAQRRVLVRQHTDGRSQQDGEHQDGPEIEEIAFGHDASA
jgi:hypothetical protein